VIHLSPRPAPRHNKLILTVRLRRSALRKTAPDSIILVPQSRQTNACGVKRLWSPLNVCLLGHGHERIKSLLLQEIDATQIINRYARALAGGIVMHAHSPLALAIRRHGLVTSTLRCDHCRGEFSFSIERYWHMQFCSSSCMTAYQQRLAPETKLKIYRLDILHSAI
jgi:hypothetical protein